MVLIAFINPNVFSGCIVGTSRLKVGDCVLIKNPDSSNCSDAYIAIIIDMFEDGKCYGTIRLNSVILSDRQHVFPQFWFNFNLIGVHTLMLHRRRSATKA